MGLVGHTTLGTTDLDVSQVCMGCMGFGDATAGRHHWTLGPDESEAIIKQGLEAGINFFDTALGYAGGTSEQYLGRALAKLARRESVVVATKFAARTDDEIARGVDGIQHVLACLDQSLKNLGMDYVDLYICHMWDYRTPIAEIMEGLAAAVRAGKVRYVGISNCFAWQLAEINAVAESHGWPQFASVQGHYNLIAREEEREMIPYCRAHGIAITPYSALAAGRLAKHPGESSKRLELDAYAKGKYDATAEVDGRIIARVAELADKHETSMTAIALAWLFAQGAVPVVGMTKPHHVAGAVDACTVELSADELSYLEEPYVPHALVGVMAQNHA